MKNLTKLLSTQSRMFCVITIAAVIGFTMTGCDNGGGGSAPKPNTDPKTLVITGLANDYWYGDVGIYTAGTSLADVQNGVGLIAGADHNNSDIIYTEKQVTYPLYNISDNNRWTGSGSYDVYWFYSTVSGNASDMIPYKASNVSFNAATTTVAFSKFSIVTP